MHGQIWAFRLSFVQMESDNYKKGYLLEKIHLPYQVACRLTLPVTNLHLFRSWAVRLAFSKVRSVNWVMLSLHCSLGLPLPRLPSTMPSSRSLCRESCLMICQKNESFLFFSVSKSDFLVPAIRITSSCPAYSQHAPQGPHFECFKTLMWHFADGPRLDSIQQCWSDKAFD